MQFKKFEGGPDADYATMTGAALGVQAMPGPRAETLPKSDKNFHLQGVVPLPHQPQMFLDAWHGDIGVMRKEGVLNLSKLQEPYKRALRQLLHDAKPGQTRFTQELMDHARKHMSPRNILIQLIFGPIAVREGESAEDRMGRMTAAALEIWRTTEHDKPESSLEFPSDQKKGTWPYTTTRGL